MKKPAIFGKYLLLERINVGGMAEVFIAKAFGVEGFERILAIKRILPTMAEDEEFITMFIDEARISVQLNHANIVHIHELGKFEHAFFIAMEYVAGRDLRAILERYRRRREIMPTAQAVFIASRMCDGLDYAHRKKDARGRDLHIIHRDVSPQNILVSYDGEVKIIDFGIAKAANRSQKTQAGILKGKFGYMSPEQVRGLPIDRRSDVFAVGVILYEMLTGEKLFMGESDFSTLEKVRNADVPSPRQFNPNIPLGLEKVVLRALSREPEDRYQWASDLQEDLMRFLLAGETIYSAKHLSSFMKEAFAEDLMREAEKMERFATIERPEQIESSGITASLEKAKRRLTAPSMPTMAEGERKLRPWGAGSSNGLSAGSVGRQSAGAPPTPLPFSTINEMAAAGEASDRTEIVQTAMQVDTNVAAIGTDPGDATTADVVPGGATVITASMFDDDGPEATRDDRPLADTLPPRSPSEELSFSETVPPRPSSKGKVVIGDAPEYNGATVVGPAPEPSGEMPALAVPGGKPAPTATLRAPSVEVAESLENDVEYAELRRRTREARRAHDDDELVDDPPDEDQPDDQEGALDGEFSSGNGESSHHSTAGSMSNGLSEGELDEELEQLSDIDEPEEQTNGTRRAEVVKPLAGRPKLHEPQATKPRRRFPRGAIWGGAAALIAIAATVGLLWMDRPTAKVILSASPESARVTIGNQPIRPNRALNLRPGRYELQADAPGYQKERRQVDLVGGEQRLRVELKPEARSAPHQRTEGAPASSPALASGEAKIPPPAGVPVQEAASEASRAKPVREAPESPGSTAARSPAPLRGESSESGGRPTALGKQAEPAGEQPRAGTRGEQSRSRPEDGRERSGSGSSGTRTEGLGGSGGKTVAAVRAKGRLACATRPAGAEIWIDGKKTDRVTPVPVSKAIELSVGQHKVVFKLDQKQSGPHVVSIEDSEVAVLRDIVVE